MWKWKKANNKEKGKEEKKDPTPTTTYNDYIYTTLQQFTYYQLKLICIDCGKKLLSMGICCGNNKEYLTVTKFYCHACIIKCFGRPKQQEKWDNKPCLACGETLLDEGMWNDIPGQEKIMTIAKIEGVLPEKIRTIKNNPPELIKLDWDPEPVINLLDPEQFHEHYQELASTRKK
ncbi:hypothetical protein G9A89_007107 [Geosiphon pyriformis]|nr:hypothetical protein G9A89_007107 [Geosiphon pyriformis]